MDMQLVMKEVLLNLFLILTPIYFFPFISNQFTFNKGKILFGAISGFASILCMTFPIVYGEGFIWDLRWVSFVIGILYGGPVTGLIAGIMLVVYRFSLGGILASISTLCVAVILFLLFCWIRKKFQNQRVRTKIYLGFGFGVWTYIIVLLSIWIHFMLTSNVTYFYQEGMLVFFLMGACYSISMVLFIYFTESILFYAKLAENVHQVEKSNMISELSTLFSYEIKRPLDSAREYVEKISVPTNSISGIYRNKAIEEMDQTTLILNDYLSNTKIHGPTEAFSLEECLNGVVALIKPYVSVKQVTLVSRIEMDVLIPGEITTCKQIILNIIKNAVDATPKGGKIQLTAELKRNKAIIVVNDTGIGMAREVLMELENRQLLGIKKYMGKGLAVSYELVDKLGGSLTFQSEPEKGTTAIIILPIRK